LSLSKKIFVFLQMPQGTNRNADSFARFASESAAAVSDLDPQIDGFLEAIDQFWSSVADAAHYHIQDISGSKAVFGGDLFPSYAKNIASSVGLYVDTIVLSDPFLQSKHVFDLNDKKQRVYYFVKHAVNLLQYKDIATAGTNNPIVTIVPFRSTIDAEETDFLRRATLKDALKHATALFGRDFESWDAVLEFTSSLDSPEKLVSELAQPDRLVFDLDWKGSHLEQINRALKDVYGQFVGQHAGNLVAAQCFGRMGQATDILLKSRYLSGTPMIDAPTSWRYFNWKLEYNSALDLGDHTPLHMVRGLQHAASTDAQWLGNIPPAALIEMRKQGAFEEIRNVLSAGIDDIAKVNPKGFYRSSDKIIDNINNAFDRHQVEIKNLSGKKLRFAGHDLGSWLVTGALEITAAITGDPSFAVAGVVANQALDAPKLREIPSKFLSLKNAHAELRKSPMGMLFSHK
jgi:hypothetical protein